MYHGKKKSSNLFSEPSTISQFTAAADVISLLQSLNARLHSSKTMINELEAVGSSSPYLLNHVTRALLALSGRLAGTSTPDPLLSPLHSLNEKGFESPLRKRTREILRNSLSRDEEENMKVIPDNAASVGLSEYSFAEDNDDGKYMSSAKFQSSPSLLTSLPQGALGKVLEYCKAEEVGRLMMTARQWHSFGQDAHYWKQKMDRVWPGISRFVSGGEGQEMNHHDSLETGGGGMENAGAYYNFFLRQKAAVNRAVAGDRWWSKYTLMLKLYNRADGDLFFSHSQPLCGRFESDVTGHANFSNDLQLEYSGALIGASARSGFCTSTFELLLEKASSSSLHNLRDWFLSTENFHAECTLLDRQTGLVACVYATAARDIRDGRLIVEEEEEGQDSSSSLGLARRFEVVEVFKKSPHHALWSRLHYAFQVVHVEEGRLHRRVRINLRHGGLLLEGLKRKMRPYHYDDGAEWRAVRTWVQSLQWF